MNRRELIALMARLLAGAAATTSGFAGAQQRPRIPRIGIIDDGAIWKPFRDALREAGYIEGRTIAVEARTANDLDGAFAILARERPDVVLVTNDAVHQSRIQKIIGFLFQHGLPAMFQDRDSAVAGGLMSYGASIPDMFRQGAFFTH